MDGQTGSTEEVLLRTFNPDSWPCITLHTLLRPGISAISLPPVHEARRSAVPAP